MPAEKGEKRPEKAEDSHEDDKEGDHIEWCLKQYEGTMNHPTTSNEETPEKTKPEEHRVDDERRKQPTDSQSEKPSTETSMPQQKDQQDSHQGETTTAEHPQKPEEQHQQNSQEASQHREASPIERPNPDHDMEADVSARQATDHQEEKHSPLRLSEEPKAFAEGNRELLVKQGIIPEKDQAKLDDKTTAKFDVNEGLTIIHKDQNYKITTVEQERIGDLELHKYKTGQGEEFLHIPSENKVAPPYETPWYALPKTTTIYLDKNYQRELLKDAIDKAGGVKALQGELEKMRAHTHTDSLYDYCSGRANGMFTEKLIPILRYLERDPDEINKHIKAIGKGEAIENAKLPFKLDTTDGTRLLAARLSDGTLYTPEGRGPRFSYRNEDEEQRNRVAESLTNVFGEVNTKYIHYTEHGRDRSLITTLPEIVGHTLQRAGAISGEVIKQNPDIPIFIQQGTREMKREWLRQAFGDEGSIPTGSGMPEMSRAVDVTHRLSDEQRKQLDTLSEGWPKTTYPDGREEKYSWPSRLPGDIQEAIDIRPRLLQSEARIISEDFGIEPKISTGKIYARADGYSLMCVLHIKKEDTRTFCDEIGFPQQRKQEKLANMLKNEGG